MHNVVQVNRLVIVGTGSSYYAAETVVCLLREEAEAKGIEMFSVVPTRMGVFATPKPGVLYWVVSQSGKSTSTEQTAKILREKGAQVKMYCQIGGKHCEADWEKQLPILMNYLWK